MGTPYTTTMRVFSKALCVLSSIYYIVHGTKQVRGQGVVGRDGYSFTILLFMEKIPNQCYMEARLYAFLWNFLQWVCNCIFTMSIVFQKSQQLSLSILLRDQMNKANN